jgi:hypothetical protein
MSASSTRSDNDDFFAHRSIHVRKGAAKTKAPGRSRSRDKQNPKASAEPIIEEPPNDMNGSVMPLAGSKLKFTAI